MPSRRLYKHGMVMSLRTADRAQKLSAGDYTVAGIDHERKQLMLTDSKGRQRRFSPARLRPGDNNDRLSLFERQALRVFTGDRIRWTTNDYKRGLFNADQASVVAIDEKGITLQTSSGALASLPKNDPMFKRLDLAYALNAHMAQGLTSDRGIAVMDSRERNLANQQTFLVTVTRLRDGLTIVADNAEKLGRAIKANSGEKTSALEVTERLKTAAARGTAKGKEGIADEAVPVDKPELSKERVKPFEIGI